MEACPYCDLPIWEPSPEHVFPRSIGGTGLVIGVHAACNRRANTTIDQPLAHCGHVLSARAAVGVASARTGAPYEEKLTGETILMVRPPDGADCDLRDNEGLLELLRSSAPYGVPGSKVQVRRRGDELTTRLLPNPVPSEDGIFDVYTTDDTEGSESDRVDPYTVVAFVKARRTCSHPVDTWRRFTAKVGTAAIHVLRQSDVVLDNGFPVREILSPDDFRAVGSALRDIAFGAGAGGDVAREPFATKKNERPKPMHVAGFGDKDGKAVMAVRLFDSLNYRIDLPDVEVRQPVQLSIDAAVAHGRAC